MLKENNYKQAFLKMAFGRCRKFLPTNHGFDEFYDTFSNDMWKFHPEDQRVILMI